MTGRSPVQPPDKSGQGEIKKKAEKLPFTTTEVSRPLILTAQRPTDKTVLVLSSDQGEKEIKNRAERVDHGLTSIRSLKHDSKTNPAPCKLETYLHVHHKYFKR